MRNFLHLCCIFISLLVILSACGNRNITAEDVQKALEQQGLEVAKTNVGTTEQGEGSSLQLDGVYPEIFRVALPAAGMESPEYVLIYEFTSEEESKSANKSDGISTLKMGDLHANIAQRTNAVVVYWSQNKENPLMMKQFTKAMEEL